MMKIFVANWKMNMGKSAVDGWIDSWNSFEVPNDVTAIVAPSFLHLSQFKSINNCELATQDISKFDKGTHTGDVAGFQISEFCKYVIVGHSERKESPKIVKEKLKRCKENNLTPILCYSPETNLGEIYEEGIILCIEDPQNISRDGNFNSRDPKQLSKEVKEIKNQVSNEIPIIYGGSVNRDNISDLKNIEALDGVLSGGASLDANHFFELITLK